MAGVIAEPEEIEVLIGELSERTGKGFSVSSRELWEYLHAETYEDDVYTAKDVLSNEYLLFHELLEIECLKGKGLGITPKVIIENPETVYECHLMALEEELELALKEGDLEWVEERLKDAEGYLEDEHLPERQREEEVRILRKFGQGGKQKF